MLNSIKPKGRVIFGYLIIPVALFIFTVFVPLIAALVYSFYDWKVGPNKTFNGIQNYIQLFNDRAFWASFEHNIFLVIFCIVGQVGIAFILVMIISSKLVKFKGIHRTFGFFPSTISAVCIGFIWTMIYDQRRGLLNFLLLHMGKINSMKDGTIWLNEPDKVMTLVSIPLVWQYIGYYMVILLSAVASIDTEVLESSELDGANGWQRAKYIVLPLIKNTLIVCVTLCVAGNMKAFDNIYVMTAGGPGYSSMVMALYGYKTSFETGYLGYGSCISVAIFVLSLIVIGGSQAVMRSAMTDKYDKIEAKLQKQRDKEMRAAAKAKYGKGGLR